ncbi:17S U2 SnRNP complex component HTATSF1-like [Diadema setosum]|uniref:17S U2 SnRNP complex component HTATSF1-like n=1 Tax=Diadema setosum TaxID=31175 RepID=UPI003B3B8BD4
MESDDFEWQLKQEQEEQWKRDNGYIYTDPNDGSMYEWDPQKQAWFPREDATLITEIKDDLQSECSRFGEVKKVLIFDRHPDGVASVKFKDAENADTCIKALNGRWFAKRQLEVQAWDGKTDYKIEETDKERDERLKKWQDFLEEDEEKEDVDGEKGPGSKEGAGSEERREEDAGGVTTETVREES